MVKHIHFHFLHEMLIIHSLFLLDYFQNLSFVIVFILLFLTFIVIIIFVNEVFLFIIDFLMLMNLFMIGVELLMIQDNWNSFSMIFMKIESIFYLFILKNLFNYALILNF